MYNPSNFWGALHSQEGSFEMLLFYLIMNDLWRGCFPVPERGFKGCVTVRGAAWAEELRDTVSRGLVLRGIIRQASGDHFDFQEAVLGRHTPPAPLKCTQKVGQKTQ